ncbi:MAG: ATP-binding protein [Acidobacteriaceae bacterium]
MRGLFFKIFAIFWLAQSLIFIITTTLIIRQRFAGPSTFGEALDINFHHDADLALRDYQLNGCPGFRANTARLEPSGAALLDASGHLLCSTANAPALPAVTASLPNHIQNRPVGSLFAWFIPTTASDGTHFDYVWFQTPSNRAPRRRWDFVHFAFPQLPVAIAVGGLTTFVLVLLFTRPLVRLRKAARALAGGKLNTRVEQSPSAAARASSDEFQGLVHDFNHMAERLESLVGAQKLLLRDVSHELRSPLARLSVALELAREDATSQTVDTSHRGGTALQAGTTQSDTTTPALSEHLNRIEREAEKLNQLIGQLLTLSSMESREARENTSTFKPVSLNQLCEQLLPDAEYEAHQRSCTVTLLQDADCTIRGDHDLLYRAIENVVRNAIRYTDPGTEVTLRIGSASVNGLRSACIEVSDHGPGIPEAQLANIFRPFYRLDHARSSSTGGFGVGLAITERAVRLHGGTIHASNRPSGGTSITFLFPQPVAPNAPTQLA